MNMLLRRSPCAGHHALSHALPAHHLHHAGMTMSMHDSDSDPRELEAFAERFKQRRIKLSVTQADVGKALANLRLPGVGALSQSTICRSVLSEIKFKTNKKNSKSK